VQFFAREELLVDVFRPLEGRVGGVRPEALDVGLTIRRPRDLPFRGCRRGRLGRRRWSLGGHVGRRDPHGQQQSANANCTKNATAHGQPPRRDIRTLLATKPGAILPFPPASGTSETHRPILAPWNDGPRAISADPPLRNWCFSMRLDDLRESENVEDRRQGGARGFATGPGGLGIGGLLLLIVASYSLGIDPTSLLNSDPSIDSGAPTASAPAGVLER